MVIDNKIRYFRLFLLVVGSFFIMDSGYLLAKYHLLHFGVILPMGIGLVFVVHAVFWQRLHNFLQTKPRLFCAWWIGWGLFLVWFLSFLLFVMMLKVHLTKNEQLSSHQEFSAIIVLGTGFKNGKPSPVLANRLDRAGVLAKNNPKAVIILTGGIGFNKTVSEASVMATYLQEQFHLPLSQMMLEDKSTSTELNLKNSWQILQSAGVDLTKPIAIVTSDFHTLRAVKIAKKQNFVNVVAVGVKTPLYIRYHNWLREYFAWASSGLLGEF